jgi:hypothetical protein
LEVTVFFFQICANWFDFHDPESGLSSYKAGVGTDPRWTDVADLKKLDHQVQEYCFNLQDDTLQHNNVYYFIVWAVNAASNQKNVSAVSNGGMIKVI